MKYVDVIVPLPIAGEYTYSLPPALEGKVHGGCRVVVPFGPKKYYTAIVVSVHDSAPEAYETKDILEVLDECPVLLKRQFDFWQWVSDYYLCTIGDVYKAALPSGLKLESETMVVYNPDFEASGPLPPKEQLLLDLLSANPEQCVTQLEKAAGIRNILPVVRSLLEKEAVCIKEELKRSYKPKTEIRVRLAGNMRTEKALQFQMNMLDRPKTEKQLAVLMKYVELSGWNGTGETLKEVSRKRLTEAAGVSPAVLDALVRKQVLEIYSSEVGRLDGGRYDTLPLNPLSEAQRRAFYQIMSLFQTRNVCLLSLIHI